MRRFSRVALLAVSSVMLAASGIVASVSGAGAGSPVPVTNSLTILKTVSGEVPEGTTFTVRVACTNSIIDDGDPVASQDVHFDATGLGAGQRHVREG